jgi:hypothetical protein
VRWRGPYLPDPRPHHDDGGLIAGKRRDCPPGSWLLLLVCELRQRQPRARGCLGDGGEAERLRQSCQDFSSARGAVVAEVVDRHALGMDGERIERLGLDDLQIVGLRDADGDLRQVRYQTPRSRDFAGASVPIRVTGTSSSVQGA